MEERLVGTVTHYFHKPQVAAIKVTAPITVGDVLRFRGHTTDFQQQIASMEIEHAHVEAVTSGAVAIKVSERVREGDEVYRVLA